MKNKNKQTSKSPGRPRFVLAFPKHVRQFTIGDLFLANGVDPESGKGEKCSALTVRNNVKFLVKSKILELVEDKFGEPDSEKGLGRKQFVYKRVSHADAPAPKQKREKKEQLVTAVTVAPSPAPVSEVASSPETPIADAYEATKAALGIETPSPAEPVAA